MKYKLCIQLHCVKKKKSHYFLNSETKQKLKVFFDFFFLFLRSAKNCFDCFFFRKKNVRSLSLSGPLLLSSFFYRNWKQNLFYFLSSLCVFCVHIQSRNNDDFVLKKFCAFVYARVVEGVLLSKIISMVACGNKKVFSNVRLPKTKASPL